MASRFTCIDRSELLCCQSFQARCGQAHQRAATLECIPGHAPAVLWNKPCDMARLSHDQLVDR